MNRYQFTSTVETNEFDGLKQGKIRGIGLVTKKYTDKPNNGMCQGCRDSKPYCPLFAGAVVVDKAGISKEGDNQFTVKRTKTLDCWHSMNR